MVVEEWKVPKKEVIPIWSTERNKWIIKIYLKTTVSRR